jgi:hypothetical protein
VDPGSDRPDPLPLVALAGRVPEEVDGDAALREAALVIAVDAIAEQLGD